MSEILIGWAEETLVPPKKVSLSGRFFLRVSEYVEFEITATAMAGFEKDWTGVYGDKTILDF